MGLNRVLRLGFEWVVDCGNNLGFAIVGCGFEFGLEAWVLNGLWVFSGVCIGFEWVMDLRLVSEFRWYYFGGCIGFESVTETWVCIDL